MLAGLTTESLLDRRERLSVVLDEVLDGDPSAACEPAGGVLEYEYRFPLFAAALN